MEGFRTLLILPGNNPVKIKCVQKDWWKWKIWKGPLKKEMIRIKQKQQWKEDGALISARVYVSVPKYSFQDFLIVFLSASDITECIAGVED